jgi:hypothetical protein
MSESHDEKTRKHHSQEGFAGSPTTQQMRTVGQRRRDAEEKLEHHLEEARHGSNGPTTAGDGNDGWGNSRQSNMKQSTGPRSQRPKTPSQQKPGQSQRGSSTLEWCPLRAGEEPEETMGSNTRGWSR